LIVPIAVGLFGSYQATGRNYKIVDKAPGILDLIERDTERIRPFCWKREFILRSLRILWLEHRKFREF
jgi:hypothetical protein